MRTLDITIDFREYPGCVQLIEVISPAFNLLRNDMLNLSIIFSGSIVHSDNLLIVASLVNNLRSCGIIVSVKVTGADSYASRIDFYNLIGIEFEEKYARKNSSGRFIEIKAFNSDTIYSLQDKLNMILYQNGKIHKDILQLLFYCLGEIMDNILVHSGLEVGWVSAQFYPQKHQIMLTICDYGAGIHYSLTNQLGSKYKDVSEAEALDLCIRRGVTNGEGLGFGLFATSEFILKNSGELLLYSGSYYLNAKQGLYDVKKGAFWKGTLVSLRINTNIPVDYKSIMPEHHTLPDDYAFFIDKFFGDDNELW
jgi:hypothetical protein